MLFKMYYYCIPKGYSNVFIIVSLNATKNVLTIILNP